MYLIINDIEMQLDENTIISFTKEDASAISPATLCTPYSKSISLPRTPHNERAFAYLGNLQTDFSRMSFSPIKKAKAVVMLDTGFNYQGYVHMDKLTDTTIECTMYLAFGDLFDQLKNIYPGEVFKPYASNLLMDQSEVIKQWNLLGSESDDPSIYANWGYGLN